MVKKAKTIGYYTHTVPSNAATVVNPEPGYYYVSVKKDSQTEALALGPFEQHQDAIDHIGAVRQLVIQYDSWAHFWKLDTYKLTDLHYGNLAHTIPGQIKPGTLNRHFPDAPVRGVA